MADPVSLAINIAASVALSLVSALLTPKQKIEGPRLKDRRITTSAYGETIPVAFGTNRLFGNVIWGTDIEEEKRTTNIGKGSLFSAGKQTTYTYFANFAVAFGEGEAVGVLKLYADGQLIYNAEDETGEGGRIEGLKFRFYPGSATQDVDPLIQEDIDGRFGADSTPAFRGTTYVVFERLPLGEFGNRIPQIEAVIAWKGSSAQRIGVRPDTGDVDQSFQPQQTVIDRARNVVYAATPATVIGVTPVLTAHSLRTGELIASRTISDILNEVDPLGANGWENPGRTNVGTLAGAEGDYLFLQRGLSNTAPVAMIDKATLSGIATFGTGGASYETTETALTGFCMQMAVVPVQDNLGRLRHYVVGGGTNLASSSNLWIIERDIAGGFKYTFGADFTFGASDVPVGIQAGPSRIGYRDVWIATREPSAPLRSDGYLTIWQLRLRNVPTIGGGSESDDGEFQILPEVIYEQPASGPFGDGLVAMAWDESAGGLLVSDPGVGSGLLNVETGSFVWFESGANGVYPPADQVGTVVSDGGGWPTYSGKTYVFRDAGDGDVTGLTDFNWSDTFTSGASNIATVEDEAPIWDPAITRAYAFDTDKRLNIIYGDRITGAAETLQNVVRNICTRGALSASDVDVTGLSGTVSGYKIERQTSLRDALAPLGVAYNFDAAEVGGAIEFKHRDGLSDVTIAEDDLVPDKDGIALNETRGQEIEAPLAVSLEYVAPDRDYQTGTQIVRRIQNPVPVVNSNSESVVQLPIALTDTQAVQAAERVLFQSWIERERFSFAVSAEFLRVVPNDVLTVTADGQTRTIRAQRVSVGGDNRAIEVEAVASEAFVYDEGYTAVTEALPVPQEVPGNFAVLLPHVFDIPLLRDEDDAGTSALIYVGASREIASPGAFDGANISVAVGGAEYESRAYLATEATFFASVTALADAPDDEFYSIHDTSFTVRLIRGTAPSTVTDAQLIGEDANTLAVWNNTTQGWEIVGVRTVTDNGDGTYTFDGIFRSKRGSETHAFGHAAGDRVVLLTEATVDAYTSASATLGATAGVIATETGQLLENGGRAALTYRLEGLKPYAPVQVSATLDGSDIDLAWVRRTRLAGAWLDGTGTVAIGEESESYSIDIYSGPTDASPVGTVVRTLTSTTSSVTYTAAQIATDFGSTPSELTVKVYQISAAVGRGFALEKTIEVA